MQPKQNPTHPEALLLIRLKRDRATAAMDQIVKRFGVISTEPTPGLEVLLDYLTNMVYALELLLKVMANDWRTPGKTQFGHDVGAMYREIFGKSHPTPDLMTILEQAILNQKFIYEPADRLMDHIPELEALWDELTVEFYRQHWMEDTWVRREVVPPTGLMKYLRENLSRFYLAETYQWMPPLAPQHRMKMLQHQIQNLQTELERVQAGEEPPEETDTQIMERLQLEHAEKLKAAASCFDVNSQILKCEFRFSKITFSKVMDGCLG